MEDIKLVDNEIDKKEESLILEEMSKIDGIYNYFKALLASDCKRYFMAQPEQQERIKGNYDRTMQQLIAMQKVSLDKKE